MWRNKQGSFTAFAVMLFSAMLILVFALLAIVGKMAIFAGAEDFGRLWGTSILAEFDLNLKDRYGLFAFYGEPSMIEDKLKEYVDFTFDSKKYIAYDNIKCSLDNYLLTDTGILKNQIIEIMALGSKPHAISGRQKEKGQSNESGPNNAYGERWISARWILDSLPSGMLNDTGNIYGIAEQIKEGAVFRELVGSSMVNQYIFRFFHHNRSDDGLGETYFKNEIEYMICGKPDDRKARENVRSKLVVLRNLLNLAYLYSSAEKKEIAMAAAIALTPGPEAPLTQGVLLELWAFAEAENDMELLYDDKQVPLLKQDQNWALTLENVLGQGTSNEKGKMDTTIEGEKTDDNRRGNPNYISPPVLEGIDYEGYLQILINMVPERTRLLRIMDLIQINMKYLYCDYFLLSDYYTGLHFSMEVNGRVHQFEENYERKSVEK
ncbi:MAG: hypothetical protein HFE73_10545 [Firmicutes bacterium]|nr:hypothetical protein [Bacillota bacterium]